MKPTFGNSESWADDLFVDLFDVTGNLTESDEQQRHSPRVERVKDKLAAEIFSRSTATIANKSRKVPASVQSVKISHHGQKGKLM